MKSSGSFESRCSKKFEFQNLLGGSQGWGEGLKYYLGWKLWILGGLSIRARTPVGSMKKESFGRRVRCYSGLTCCWIVSRERGSSGGDDASLKNCALTAYVQLSSLVGLARLLREIHGRRIALESGNGSLGCASGSRPGKNRL